jgi:hypothetical protein
MRNDLLDHSQVLLTVEWASVRRLALYAVVDHDARF